MSLTEHFKRTYPELSFLNEKKFKIVDPVQDRLITILRRISDNKDPFYDPNDYGNEICFFCSEDKPDHEIDCPYILAQQLLSEIDKV